MANALQSDSKEEHKLTSSHLWTFLVVWLITVLFASQGKN